MADDKLVYAPPDSLVNFFASEKFISLVLGAIGSTKTTAGIMKIAYHASQMAPCKDGIRRSRAIWVRNTREQLRDTSIPDFLEWYKDGEAGVFLKSEGKFIMRFADVECEVLFRGLEDSNDVRRLLSLQASFGILDEFREINPDIYTALQGRLGRYPNKKMNGVGCVTDADPVSGVRRSNAHLWGMSNPPDADTFWEELLTNPPDNVHVTIQPSGMSPEADWLQYLPDGYYDNLANGKSEEWIDVYIHGKFGRSLSGKPVFRSFNKDIHVSDKKLRYNPASANPLIIGFDCTGLNPAAVICQLGYESRLFVLKELSASDMGALRFIREILKPVLVNEFSTRALVVIDPAGMNRGNDEKNVADLLKAEKLKVIPARTNGITARVAAIESYLTRLVGGQAGLIVDPDCKILIQALQSKYRFKVNTKGVTADEPEKLHPWADLCFAAGTLVSTPDGAVPIETVKAGDIVITPYGTATVAVSAMTSREAEVYEYVLSNGTVLTATPNHPVYVATSDSFMAIDSLQYSDVLISIDTPEVEGWSKGIASFVENALARHHGAYGKGRGNIVLPSATMTALELLMGLRSMEYGSLELAAINTTGQSSMETPFPHTSIYGKSTMAHLQPDTIYTTLTETTPTTRLATSRLYPPRNTLACTLNSVSQTVRSTIELLWQKVGKLLRLGTPPTKAESGTGSMGSKLGKAEKRQPLPASSVELSTKGTLAHESADSVPQPARAQQDEPLGSTTSNGSVQYAPLRLPVESMPKHGHAVRIAGKRRLHARVPVYSIQLDNEPMFYANGVLVHNCDALQYAALHADGGAIFGANVVQARREVKPATVRWAR